MWRSPINITENIEYHAKETLDEETHSRVFRKTYNSLLRIDYR